MQRKSAMWLGMLIGVVMIAGIIVIPIRQTLQQEQARQNLFRAVQRNDAKAVRRLLESGADANAHTRAGQAAGLMDLIKITLHLQPQSSQYSGLSVLTDAVIRNGDPEIARLLLAHGAVCNAIGGGWTPLAAALATGNGPPNPAVIRLLLQRGANPNLRPPGDGTLFYALAADGQNVDLGPLTKMLLEHGADPLQPERDGRTYLTSEIWAKHPKAVAAMLDHGADINARDRDTQGIPGNPGTTPLGAALAGRQLEMVKMLLARGALIGQIDGEGIIREAADGPDEGFLKAVIARGVSIDSKNRLGFTPLMNAACSGDPRQIASMKMLLAHGASVRERNNAGQTPLIVACWYPQDLPKVKMLLAHGADPNARENYGNTALVYAAGMAGGETVPYLLAHGADAHLVNNAGETALMRAAEIDGGHPEVIASLVAAGCDPNAQDKKGRTALMLARLKRHAAVIQALRKAGATR